MECKEIDISAPFTIEKNRSWIFDKKRFVIKTIGRHWYEVDLERCLTAPEILDWIVQLHKKTWVDDKIIYDLIEILDDILDIQGNIVHSSQPISKNELKSQIKIYLERLVK